MDWGRLWDALLRYEAASAWPDTLSNLRIGSLNSFSLFKWVSPYHLFYRGFGGCGTKLWLVIRTVIFWMVFSTTIKCDGAFSGLQGKCNPWSSTLPPGASHCDRILSYPYLSHQTVWAQALRRDTSNLSAHSLWSLCFKLLHGKNQSCRRGWAYLVGVVECCSNIVEPKYPSRKPKSTGFSGAQTLQC